jgi:glyoxylase-like metal-dependent hydrolase (beta-lactamase superfamily II)
MTLRTLCLGELDTNCYIVWDDNRVAMVVDPADDADKILSVIQSEKLSVAAVVLTHVHFDHLLAAEEVCTATGAPLCIGKGDEDALSDPIRNLSGVFQMCAPVHLKADKLLSDGAILMVGDLSFTVMETPGHTPGCICLIGENVLFAGDTLFYDSIGRVDFPGSDVPSMISSLRRLKSLSAELRVYSGHGPETTIGREVACNPYLQRI